jgi:hypothetical protein
MDCNAANIVATINGNPITDADITARAKLMSMQGNTATNNRKQALQNIIDDYVKLDYAANFKAIPDDKTVAKELKEMKLGEMSATDMAAAKSAVRANIAWQTTIARTILPTTDVSKEDLDSETADLSRARGLPVEITFIRVMNAPDSLKMPDAKNCAEASQKIIELGGAPQKITALEYEMADDIREALAGLPLLAWSPKKDNMIFFVCEKKKTKEYGKLDEIIKQNVTYKKAMFAADQQLKQLRRKAVVVINDKNYSL